MAFPKLKKRPILNPKSSGPPIFCVCTVHFKTKNGNLYLFFKSYFWQLLARQRLQLLKLLDFSFYGFCVQTMLT